MKKVKQTHKRESKNGGNLDIKTKSGSGWIRTSYYCILYD